MSAAKDKSTRLVDLDAATGIAIVLVVVGHLYFQEAENVGWYSRLRHAVYLFHMPFFMYLSGFLIEHSITPEKLAAYGGVLRKKVRRFAIPYFLLSGVFLIGNVAIGEIPVVDIASSVRDIFICPQRGPATYLWYIYVLLIYYAIFPTLRLLVHGYPSAFLFAALILNQNIRSPLFGIGPACEFVLFFAMGMLAASNYDAYRVWMHRYGWYAVVVFVSLLIGQTSLGLPTVLVGIASIPAIHFISTFKYVASSRVLSYLGRNTFVIYLLNTFFIGAIYVILFRVFAAPAEYFSWVIPLMLTGGLLGPLLASWMYDRVKANPLLRSLGWR